MRLLTVKLKIQQHVTSECTRLRKFVAALVTPLALTTTPSAAGTIVEVDVSSSLPQNVNGRGMEPCSEEHDMAVDIGRSKLIDEAYSASCPDEKELLVETEHLPSIVVCALIIYEQVTWNAMHLRVCCSHVTGVSDIELDSCNVTDGEGVVAEVPVPTPIPEAGGRVTMMR
ncbi:Hypothetical predicted protein [Olea europaea subsp. europaea]|uniref:Uncharacterized protein n=1 Tax=Olea europaea subsp. europaea TaxID=158383 RepID=A0A8S0VFV8_OLEEU|nr:Hypothetical predicted protein [Olea europaea subsp. europaea]